MLIHIVFPTPAPAHAHLLLLFCVLFPVKVQPQSPSPPPQDPFAKMKFDKTMASVLVILVMVFFTLGFISIYTRQCRERRIRGRFDLAVPINGSSGCQPPHGLDPTIIENFPNFVYSEVKDIKIGRVTLECAVCLNEFADDETLRLIPNCSHVFHRDCIDVWLFHHSTCPVCRANLDEVSSSIKIQILDTNGEPNIVEPVRNHEPGVIEPVDAVEQDDRKKVEIVTPRVNLDGVNRPVRSKSMGFTFVRLFSRSHSTGHSMVRSNEDIERFTLRLPDEVQNRLVNDIMLSRTKSLGATLQSGKKSYRTRSVGRSFLRYERFNVESRSDQRGFTCAQSFLGRVGSMRSTKDVSKAPMIVLDKVDVEEHSSSCLVYND